MISRESCLEAVRAQVEDAVCDILPDWANGAIIFAPLTEQQAEEADVELRAHHIVVAQQNQKLVEEALAKVPKRSRPLVHPADPEPRSWHPPVEAGGWPMNLGSL